MKIALLSMALFQLTTQDNAQQKADDDAITQWIKDHQVEIRQSAERTKRIRALDYDQALIIYDQCLARTAASLDNVPPDSVFDRALAICLPLRIELLSGRPSEWFLGFQDLDTAKRASFPALTRQLRERLKAQASAPEAPREHN